MIDQQKNISPSPKVIHYNGETPDPDYTNLQTMLLDLLNGGINPFVTSQLAALDNAMTRKMETIWIFKMITLTSIEADLTKRVIYLLREDNIRLQNQVADLTREV